LQTGNPLQTTEPEGELVSALEERRSSTNEGPRGAVLPAIPPP
jgi:hypothetical protein